MYVWILLSIINSTILYGTMATEAFCPHIVCDRRSCLRVMSRDNSTDLHPHRYPVKATRIL